MNSHFGKIENGRLCYAPNPVVDGALHVYTTDASVMARYGYLPVVRAEPERRAGFTAVSRFERVGDEIRQVWEYEEAPDEVSDAEALAIITGGDGYDA